MNLAFWETALFSKIRDDLFVDDEHYRAFQNVLLDNPRLGEVIPGTNGVRKIRVASTGQARGKRGGLRIIYFYIETKFRIILFAAYPKNASDDLTPAQKKSISDAAQKEKERP